MANSKGTIALYHLNSDVKGRGVCVRLTPNIPGTGWACVWKDNPLYQEITAALLAAYSTGKPANVVWNNDRGGHPEITLVDTP